MVWLRMLRLQDRAAQSLRNLRQSLGALRLETIEVRPVFDGDTIRELLPETKNRAKELIEDFMIAANGVTARYLAAKGLPSIRRVVRSPKRWDRIVELASAHGVKLPDAPDSKALDAFLARQKTADPATYPDVSLAIIKLIGSGVYAATGRESPSTGTSDSPCSTTRTLRRPIGAFRT